jgi:hypothetical protein
MADPNSTDLDSPTGLQAMAGAEDRDPPHRDGAGAAGPRPPVPPGVEPQQRTTTRQVKQIADTAIGHYQRVRRDSDSATAWTAAVRHALRVHAADGLGQVDSNGDPKPTVGEARAIADVSVGRYRSLLEERGLPSRQAWSRAVHEVLGAWAPRGLSPAAWWLEEQITEEVGSRAQRAEIAATLVAYNREEGWLDRVPEYHAKAAHAAIQHDALQPTRRLRAQVAAAVELLKQRPPDQAAKLRDAHEVVGRLRRLQTVLERRPLTLGGTGERIDYERGLAQVAVRLRAASRQVAELEVGQRLGLEWDDAQAFELARAEASALTLRARELALTARLETFRPPWLDAAVGPAPADPTLRARWRRGVLEVLRWRVDHDVVDQARPLGLQPTHPAELRRYKQAVQHLSGIARSIGHTLVLAPEPGRDGPPDRLPRLADRSQPALPGRPEIALGQNVAEGIGIDLP